MTSSSLPTKQINKIKQRQLTISLFVQIIVSDMYFVKMRPRNCIKKNKIVFDTMQKQKQSCFFQKKQAVAKV